MLFFFPQGVLDEILNLIESVSEGFPSYFFIHETAQMGFSCRHNEPKVRKTSLTHLVFELAVNCKTMELHR